MPVSESPLSDWFTLFLVLFVLIGMQPTFQKGARWLSRFLDKASDKREQLGPADKDVHAAIFANRQASFDLNDFEIIVLQRLARLSNKPASASHINETLLFGDAVFKMTLWSLHRRGMVSLQVSKFLSPRFMLSENGRRYALEQGYIVEFQQKEGMGHRKAVGF